MKDIFTDIQTKIGCLYFSDLLYHKREIWHELKRLPLADYDTKQLKDFSKYVFSTSWLTILIIKIELISQNFGIIKIS